MHSKTDSETAKKRNYLSPQRAILLQLIEDNFTKRPIYFSNFCSPSFFGGLDVFFQDCGLVSRLTPVLAREKKIGFDYEKIALMLKEQNLTDYKTIIATDMPRISVVIASGYYTALMNLSDSYRYTGNQQGLSSLKELFARHIKIGFKAGLEEEIEKELAK